MTSHDDHAFDNAMRQLHTQALGNVSVRTQAQLHQRRRAALASGARTSPSRGAWPMLAFGTAAALALAIGLQLRPDALPTSESNETPAPAATSAVEFDDQDIDTLAALDENPDLYLWLASDDAADLVTE